MKNIYLLTFLFFSPLGLAELADGLKIDSQSHKEIIERDCSNTPGRVCIWHCYMVINEDTNMTYGCRFEATGFFNEKINTELGPLFTGNKLEATDFRTQIIYPYQNVEICFNFGKEIVLYPETPEQEWVFTKARIVSECNGTRRSREFSLP